MKQISLGNKFFFMLATALLVTGLSSITSCVESQPNTSAALNVNNSKSTQPNVTATMDANNSLIFHVQGIG